MKAPAPYIFDFTTQPRPISQSEYPCWEVLLTAKQVSELFSDGILDIDYAYQRGRTAATVTKPPMAVQARLRNQEHIENIAHDLSTYVNGRSIATIPPIWTNVRRTSAQPSLKSAVDGGGRQFLELSGNRKMFTFDVWHRVLSIRRTYLAGGFDPDHRFSFYIFDAPIQFEARAFRTLNGKPMPVEPNRINWVAAPWSNDFYQLAYEFIRATPSLSRQVTPGNWIYNVEISQARPHPGAGELASFTQIANGFLQAPPGERLWPLAEIDPENAADRKLVVNYMSAYWTALVELLPDLAFKPPATRKDQRVNNPLLVNGLMAQILVWLGYQLLEAYQSPMGSTKVRAKLRELTLGRDSHAGSPVGPELQKKLFAYLAPLRNGNFFSHNNPLWDKYITATGKIVTNNSGVRRFLFKEIAKTLGIDVPNSLDLYKQSAMKKTVKKPAAKAGVRSASSKKIAKKKTKVSRARA